ncbi:MAG TPA: alpha/beta fold hydrolase, partial [Ramlibacter sp.]|nr:alpha/beta fold hydrolase [Ramlibacter sp.]
MTRWVSSAIFTKLINALPDATTLKPGKAFMRVTLANRFSLLLCLLVLLTTAGCTTMTQTPPLVTEEFMVPAVDPGLQIYVRNKHAAGVDKFNGDKIVLFVHGATYPSETAFDLKLNGVSWMEYIAQRGYDVYLVDVRGYGGSTRPPAMDQPGAQNPPFAFTADAANDVKVAADFIRKR